VLSKAQTDACTHVRIRIYGACPLASPTQIYLNWWITARNTK